MSNNFNQAFWIYVICGYIRRDFMSLPPKTQLGRYEIRALIGAGGMGEVYLAPGHQPESQSPSPARLGQKEEAIAWLEKGFEQRDFRMMLISVAFEFDRFRSDPKFMDLVRRMGLPE